MTQKKSRFWTFLFSFMPGAGEMYMGFMKMGVSLMGMFFLIITVATMLEIGPLMYLAVIAWFYSFFHVHNLAGMPDEEFYSLEDEYLFNLGAVKVQGADLVGGYRKTIAIILIVVGFLMTWRGIFRVLGSYLPDYFYWIVRGIGYRLPQIVVGIGIILLGIYMIRGKKQQLYSADDKKKEPDFEEISGNEDGKE